MKVFINQNTAPSFSCKAIGLDIETTGLNPRKDKILSIALHTEDEGYVYDTAKFSSNFFKELFAEYDNTTFIVHNAKFDGSFIYRHWYKNHKLWWDTMIASQILTNGKSYHHGLIDVIERYLGADEAAGYSSQHKENMRRMYMQTKYGEEVSDEMLNYVSDDTKPLIPLYKILNRELQINKLDVVMREEMRLLPVLIKMEDYGCLIDVPKWEEAITAWEDIYRTLELELDAELVNLSKTYTGLLGGVYTRKRNQYSLTQKDLFGQDTKTTGKNTGNVNYKSNPQIVEIFERVGLTPPTISEGKGSEVKVSVGEGAVKLYLNENPQNPLGPFLNKLLKYREYSKLLSTYGENFLDKLEDGRIYTSYTQCRTATGRMSSVGPNLQNIPGLVHDFFIPAEGKSFITSDMASAEVRIAADRSREPFILDRLESDYHSELASLSYSIIFNRDVHIDDSEEEVIVDGYTYKKVDLRKKHKTVLFAKFYKAGPKRVYDVLSKYINRHHKTKKKRNEIAYKISSALDAALPELTKYLTSIIDKGQKEKQLIGTELIGRRRFFNGSEYGEMANMPIQNANAEAMKIALIKIDDYLSDNPEYDGHIILTVHDEVVVEVLDKYVEVAGNDVKNIVASSLDMFLSIVPGKASVNIDKKWSK